MNPVVSSPTFTQRSVGLATIITGRCDANARDSKRVAHVFCVLPDEVSSSRNDGKRKSKQSIANYSIIWLATAAMHPIGGGWTDLCTVFAFMGILSAALSPRRRMAIEDKLGVAGRLVTNQILKEACEVAQSTKRVDGRVEITGSLDMVWNQ